MHFFKGAATALTALLLFGCGDSDPTDTTQKTAPHDETAMSAQVQKAKAPSCPPKLTTAPRAEGTPVDDIIGLRPGLSYDEVVALIGCKEPDLTIETGRNWGILDSKDIETRQHVRATDGRECTLSEKSEAFQRNGGSCYQSHRKGRLEPRRDGTQTINVVFSGMPGEEKVYGVWRNVSFPKDAQPTVEGVIASLTEKYGEPQITGAVGYGKHKTFRWVFDITGRTMSKTNPSFSHCGKAVNSAFRSRQQWQTSCGITIAAKVVHIRGNDLIAKELEIGLLDQKGFYDANEQLKADIEAATQQANAAAAAKAEKAAAKLDL